MKQEWPGFWHGTGGDLRGSFRGIHVGTRLAATMALEAAIGIPLEGTWDGTREYGQTILAGHSSVLAMSRYVSGYNCSHKEDGLPNGSAVFSDDSPVLLTSRPIIFEVHIVGPMTNGPYSAYDDFKANGYMSAAIKRGNARRGYFYKNISEDEGSISAVVPSYRHLHIVDQSISLYYSPINDPQKRVHETSPLRRLGLPFQVDGIF